MTHTLELSPEIKDRLRLLAEKRGVETSDCALSLLKEALEETPEEEEPMPTNGAELVAYWWRHGLIGVWADRADIGDSVEYARTLREQAQRPRHGSDPS